MELFKWIQEKSCHAVLYDGDLNLCDLSTLKPDIVVSYNYRYILRKDVIAYMKGRMINLHTSLLPWNRGAHPNFWSFMEESPKGVTIHQINEGLDTGDILYQKEICFNEEEETFVTSYQKLQREIINLFQLHWMDIYHGEYDLTPQKGVGSYHRVRDLEEIQAKMSFEWSDNVAETIKKFKRL